MISTAALAGLLAAGCAAPASPHPPSAASRPATRPATPSASPRATLHVSGPCPLGKAIAVRDPSNGAAELVLVQPPTVATGAFSGYAYGPRYGYYVQFPVRITDISQTTILVNPLNFTVAAGGRSGVNIYNGNAKYSGTSTSLEHTFLDPGQVQSGPLTFDVSVPHGTLGYARAGTTVCTWAF